MVVEIEETDEPTTADCKRHTMMWGGDYSQRACIHQFPYHEEVKERRSASESSRCPFGEFNDVLLEANERVLILDQFFQHEGFGAKQLETGLILTLASDIRILSKSVDNELVSELNSERAEQQSEVHDGSQSEIDWRAGWGHIIPYAHDRFAVIDEELWHFGATVGGAHRDLNAASRGWSAKDVRAIEYFNQVWRVLSHE